MSTSDVVRVMSAILDLLAECGGSDTKIAWLSDRAADLRRADLDGKSTSDILADIHRHIPGMNGLIDQYLSPPDASTFDDASANIRFAELADELFKLTVTQSG